MTECLIAFGGNLSSPKDVFQMALRELCVNGFQLRMKSGLWRSPAWPAGSDQPDYLNAVVTGTYSGDAMSLLRLLQTIESNHGRVRTVPNAARTLDLDLLTFGKESYETEDLILPHSRMLERAFVLIPASELDEAWLEYVDQLDVFDIRATRYAGAW